MSANHKRSLLVTVAVLLAAAAPLGSAAADEVGCGTEDVVEHRKPPLRFVPFDRVDPETGAPYHPNAFIEIPDEATGETKRVRAQEYFDRLDEIERDLNLWGHTLRTEGEAVSLSRLNYCADRMKAQKGKIEKKVSEERAKYLLDEGSWWDKMKEAGKKYWEDDVPSMEELYQMVDDETYQVHLPPVPAYRPPTPSFERVPLEFKKEKTWAKELGSKKDVYVGLFPYARFEASKVEAKATAGIKIDAAVVNKWEGELGDFKVEAFSPGSGPLKVVLLGKALGGAHTLSKTLYEIGKLNASDDFHAGVRHEVTYRFSIGPVPMAARFGLMGQAGFRYGLDLYPLQVGAYAGPYASVEAYAQVGADIAIAGFGVGGTLKVLEQDLLVQGSTLFTWDEEPKITLQVAGTTSLTLLAGDLYAYAYVYYPKPWPPWKDRWEGRHTFFSWPGFRKQGTIFDYHATITPAGIIAKGDISGEDVAEMDQINREAAVRALEDRAARQLFEAAQAVGADLNSAPAVAVARQEARLSALGGAIDDAVAAYWRSIREWIDL